MECHEGYAVLMDEESRFVNAANLHYEVGQTVTEPLLLGTEDKPRSGGRRIIMRAVKVAATAACLAVVTVAGFSFFGKEKPAPRSVVFVSAAAEIEMELDDKGSVVRLKSDSDRGNEIIDKYIESHGNVSDKANVAGDLLETQLENGYISAGDTVDVLIPDDTNNYSKYKSELESGISELDLRVNLKKRLEDDHHHPEPPSPPAVTDKNAPAPETATKPTAPVPPVTAPVTAPVPDGKVTTPAVEPPTAPEAPTPPVAPEGSTRPTEPADRQQHEHPTPPHAEGPNAGIGGHGPAALPAPEQPAAPEPPTAPEAPLPHEAGEAPAEPHADELLREADENAITDSL